MGGGKGVLEAQENRAALHLKPARQDKGGSSITSCDISNVGYEGGKKGKKMCLKLRLNPGSKKEVSIFFPR